MESVKRGPGRPKKVVEEPKIEEPKVEAVKNGVFKSKFARDGITLVKPKNTPHADGTRTIDPGYTAEFEHNNWSSPTPKLAQLMRDEIKRRMNTDPLHVFEIEATP